MELANRRENPRMDIELRCRVTSPSLWAPAPARTVNLSRGGMLIAWGDGLSPLPALGQMMTVEIELPVYHEFGQRCIHCQGTVVRIEGGKVALRVGYMDFRAFDEVNFPVEADIGGGARGD
jgi:c-di-GMP-binding flagellar brake protein YcgR